MDEVFIPEFDSMFEPDDTVRSLGAHYQLPSEETELLIESNI